MQDAFEKEGGREGRKNRMTRSCSDSAARENTCATYCYCPGAIDAEWQCHSSHPVRKPERIGRPEQAASPRGLRKGR